ncbi:MAG: glucosaminidase domain-containing protein [Labilithrix sp.]|nr:glucosaminidase domain-containing protein [Labilithrix sp.]MCW5813759.1 glucosaminidase domain-containing protein [Labilithrix sp.]
MKHLRGVGFLLFAFTCAACAPIDEDVEDMGETTSAATSWDCYAPQPGHPTPAEKEAFLKKAGLSALKAERTYGVPASAILAMAAIEGGFGYTRTALYANNSFGYKFVSAGSAGGRGKYTLTCQPAWDVGNDYIVFRSLEDGILFVAYKLAVRADWANYKAATDRYRAARLADPDADPTAAVNAWIDGIADEGYNYDPPVYKRTIKSAITTHALYRFSASAIPGTSTTPP